MNTYKDVHIFLLRETHLNISTPDDLLDIPGYTFIKRNRSKGSHGGVGVYIKDNVPYIRRNDIEAENLECIWLEILLPKTKGLLIGIFYRPPYGSKYLRNDFDDELDNLLQSVITEAKECMIMGDFNCNYKKKNDCSSLKSIFSMFNFKQMINKPTRIAQGSSTLIDLLFSNEPQNISVTNTFPMSLSDHKLIGGIYEDLNLTPTYVNPTG